MENKPDKYKLLNIGFADDKMPVFKEVQGKDWVMNGEQNNYPDVLIDLFNRSAKHNAIVTGKADMIRGNGFIYNPPSTATFIDNPNPFETANDLLHKVATDLVLFGGVYINLIWNRAGTNIIEMYHLPFREMRVSKSGGEFYRNAKWGAYTKANEITKYPAFNPKNAAGESQVLFYKDYRPDLLHYPLPDYFGAKQYIEIDTEISNFHYNNIKSNFSVGTIVTFFNGQPTQEEQAAIERNIKKKHTGTDNAGGFVLNFVDKPDQKPEILRLQPDDLDKQYIELYKTVSDEIFIGHRVTNPSIFGVKEAGQLGSRQDLIDSKEIFYADYIKPKVNIIERVFNLLLKYWQGAPQVAIDKGSNTDNTAGVQAQPAAMARQRTEEDVLAIFAEFGEPAKNFRVIKTKRLRFGDEVEKEEEVLKDFIYDFEFAEPLNVDISDTDAKVLGAIKENDKLTIAEIADLTGVSVDDVNTSLKYLSESGVIKIDEKKGNITITDRGLKTISEQDILATEIFVKYRYSGPVDSRNRPFCAKVMEMDRLYTREDIDAISDRAGYNVWTQRGGWYHNPKTDVNTPYCRHFWAQQIVKRKVRL